MGAHSNLGVFSDAQALVASAASTYTLNLNRTTPRIGVGVPIYLCVRVGAAFTVCTNYTFALQGDADDGSGDPAGVWGTTFFQRTVVLASLTAGAWIFRIALPYEAIIRHIRLYYTETGSTEATGTVDAWLDLMPQSDIGQKAQVWASPVGNP